MRLLKWITRKWFRFEWTYLRQLVISNLPFVLHLIQLSALTSGPYIKTSKTYLTGLNYFIVRLFTKLQLEILRHVQLFILVTCYLHTVISISTYTTFRSLNSLMFWDKYLAKDCSDFYSYRLSPLFGLLHLCKDFIMSV